MANIYYSSPNGAGPQGPVGPSGPPGSDGAPGYSAEIDFVVNGGAAGTMPTFSGNPMFTGSYILAGNMVHFRISVEFDNIITFGTGQYYVELPFPCKYGYQIRGGCLHDASSDRQWSIGGHVVAGATRLYLNYIESNGRDEAFTHNTPLSLAVQDTFHIAGTYIATSVEN